MTISSIQGSAEARIAAATRESTQRPIPQTNQETILDMEQRATQASRHKHGWRLLLQSKTILGMDKQEHTLEDIRTATAITKEAWNTADKT